MRGDSHLMRGIGMSYQDANPAPEGERENTSGAHTTRASDASKGISTKWKRGQSGNPGGRPRAEREVRELARKHGAKALKRLVELMASTNERVAVAAASAVLDRAYGKPAQSLTGPNDTPLFPAGETTLIATAQQGAEFLAAFMANPSMDISRVEFADPAPSAALPAIEAPRLEPQPLPVAEQPRASDTEAVWSRLAQ